MVETEIDCHECDGTFTVDLDASKNGNHVVPCPNCGHEHCRVIENGRITSARWDSRNPTFQYTGTTYSATSSTAMSGGTTIYSAASSSYDLDNYPGSWTERRAI